MPFIHKRSSSLVEEKFDILMKQMLDADEISIHLYTNMKLQPTINQLSLAERQKQGRKAAQW